jgi:glycerophosphoryl diester phosphodiesterase
VEVLTDVAPALLPRVWLCSAEWERLLPYRGSGVNLVDSTRLSAMKEGPERRAATLAKEGIHAVNLFHTDWNGGLVALFHRFERVSFGWGVQEAYQLEELFRMGIDGLFSDHADRLVEAYQQCIGTIRPVL